MTFPSPEASTVIVVDDDDQGVPGVKGKKGDPGPPWVDMGDWQPDTPYPALSIVHLDGSTYGTPIDLPGMAAFDEGYWLLWASKGEKGDPGPRGLPGNPGGVGTYERSYYPVDMPSAVWTVVHGKGARMPVTVLDSDGRELRLVEVVYIDDDTVEARFGAPMSGGLEI